MEFVLCRLNFFHALLFGSDKAEVCAADFESLDQFYFFDAWQMNREDFFYAYAVRDFSNGDGRACFIASAVADHQAFVYLDTFFFFAFCVDVLNGLVQTNNHARFYV